MEELTKQQPAPQSEQPKKKFNKLAIIAFVLFLIAGTNFILFMMDISEVLRIDLIIISFFIPLVLGIISLYKTKKNTSKGKIISRLAIYFSLIVLAFITLIIVALSSE
ncbi:hypothetical protein ACFL0L_01590 [Patescibacteria group bacterium]